MAEPLFTEGDVITEKGVKLQCTFVSWREIKDGDGVVTDKEKFTYSFRDHDEVEQERKDADLPSLTKPSKGEK
jgi:hypothetical protein